MEVKETAIAGVVILEPRVYGDSRGYFTESFSQREFDEKVALPLLGRSLVFVQDNESLSVRGVLRGLHFQNPPFAQSKIVRCVSGCVMDIAVDIRKGSPTYGLAVQMELSAENHRQIFIPKGFAHGFVTLSDRALLQYKCDEFYHPEAEGGISILDPSLNLGLSGQQWIMSDKDTVRKTLSEQGSPFSIEDKLY